MCSLLVISVCVAMSQSMEIVWDSNIKLTDVMLRFPQIPFCVTCCCCCCYRLVEANVCITPDLLPTTSAAAAAGETMLCSTGLEWLAAAAICCMIGARYASHSKTSSSTLRSLRAAEAAEAAARQQLLRYEPKAVQDAAAAAAAAEASSQEDAMASLNDDTAEIVTQLLHGWLGLRFVMGQGAMFAAFITTGDLMASFAAGLVMQLMSSACCEQYLYSPRHR